MGKEHKRNGKAANGSSNVTKTEPTVEKNEKLEKLLILCDMGNIEEIKQLMSDTDPPSVSERDENDRTAMSIAKERDDVDLMEFLVKFADDEYIGTCLLEAINETKESIACTIIRNSKFVSQSALRQFLTEETTHVTDQDITPMMLAAQRNLYEVVRFLYEKGEKIERPHPYRCSCEECLTQSRVDQLRFAQRRLNAYKAITSESYLSVVSKDPFQDAFKLSGEMKNIAKEEKHFKNDYMTLASQVSEYLVKLLDRVREQSELEAILNHVDRPHMKDDIGYEEPIARIKTAVNYEEKKFVAHPSCQMKLVNLWYSGATFLERGSTLRRVAYLFLAMIVHPFLVPLYIISPNSKHVTFVKSPVIKFCAHTAWFIAFLTIIISWSLNTSTFVPSKLNVQDHPMVEHLFKADMDKPGHYITRRNTVSKEEYMILIFVIGFLLSEISQIDRAGVVDYFDSMYNFVDLTMIALYFASLSLRASILNKVNSALLYFEEDDGFILLSQGNSTAQLHYYWLNADRFYWDGSDPHHVAEGIFAIANVLTFSRVSYLLPVNELLGPLQISLGRMLYDISRFTVIFFMVFFAFLIGLDNLFWYYDDDHRILVELHPHGSNLAGQHFGSFSSALGSVFWAMFGMTSQDSINVEPYNASFTQGVALLLFGAYVLSIVIVLLNMLIAMMSSSFEQITQEADVEWKFARSQLYLEFIEEGSVLPPPVNLFLVIMKPIEIVVMVTKAILKCETRQSPPKSLLMSDMNYIKEASVRRHAAFKSTNMELDVYVPTRRFDHRLDSTTTAPRLSYREVVSRIVERFIFEVRTGDEGEETKDDLVDMRQDLSRMRRDILNSVTVQQKELYSMKDGLVSLTNSFMEALTVTDQKVQNSATKIEALSQRVDDLQKTQEDTLTKRLDLLHTTQAESLHMYLSITDRMYKTLNIISSHITNKPIISDSSITDLISFNEARFNDIIQQIDKDKKVLSDRSGIFK